MPAKLLFIQAVGVEYGGIRKPRLHDSKGVVS
jgi:hypothetical protein